MNANPFGATEREPSGLSVHAEPSDRSSVDTAWCVLEAANDLGDIDTVNICQRDRRAPEWQTGDESDMKITLEYFR